MKKKIIDKKIFWTILTIFSGLALLTTFLGCGSSSRSSEEISDTTALPVHFALSRVYNEGTEEETVKAEVIFKGEGLTTVKLFRGQVEIEDPQGNIYPLDLCYNSFGAPFYRAFLPRLEFDSSYYFNVILANGRLISNSIKTPDDDLEILAPAQGQVVDKFGPLEVSWTGNGFGHISAVISPQLPNIFNIFEIGGAVTDDDGRTIIEPDEMVNVRPGNNYLTLTRRVNRFANGFGHFSRLTAVLMTRQPIVVE